VETRCDLRGLRVEAALERVEDVLDRAASAGHPSVLFVHGLGTGALRDAVRAHLARSPYVADFAPDHPEAGGDGATLARLRE
jgi:DNA mismatch repair protein MutS2